MALLMNFTDASGVEHLNAHFRTVQINIGAASREINLTFAGYASYEAFATGKAPLAGATKSYIITGDEFLAIAMAAPVGGTLYDVLANASESYALGKLDEPTGTFNVVTEAVLVPVTQTITEPVIDPNGNPVLDDQGNPTSISHDVPVLDDQGNPTYTQKLDPQGNPVTRVVSTEPVYVSFFHEATQA